MNPKPSCRNSVFPRTALLACILGTGLALCSHAAEPVDLGEGLSYLRVHSLGESAQPLEAALAGGRALIIDLRRATAIPEDAAAFGAGLARRNSRAALLLLVGPDTSAPVAAALGQLPHGALTLGVDGAKPKPSVVVAQPADADRRAYDALDGGMKLEDLVNGKIDKERFDEASLVQEFKNGNGTAAPPPVPDPTKPAPEKAPVLTDRVLQRAIHLHRGLAALKARG